MTDVNKIPTIDINDPEREIVLVDENNKKFKAFILFEADEEDTHFMFVVPEDANIYEDEESVLCYEVHGEEYIPAEIPEQAQILLDQFLDEVDVIDSRYE
ncbi:hypothetical protein [Mycoplasma phocoenae]|uniref:DUF1292 domain-containing protein n=1 Tax=Mycoplasma phocoenae TaxID=754517 RepID=A0A858U3M5_9MOLU|nr:hypothetical protein [Mycoplasma phocoenae]QJG67022.1 hypothetical protein HGG69_01665 [Mycoplasma phocoenae]